MSVRPESNRLAVSVRPVTFLFLRPGAVAWAGLPPSGVTGGICTRWHRSHRPAAHWIAFGHT